jgi:multidrug efflux system membrane fusion protein
MNPKPTVLVALPTAALAVAAALYFSIVPGFEKVAVAPAAPPAVPVVAGVVNSHDVPLYLRGVGTVIAYNTDVVRSQITGELTERSRSPKGKPSRPAIGWRRSIPGPIRPNSTR